MVVIWSAIVFWKSLFSASLFSVARCNSNCTWAIWAVASAIPSSSALMFELSSPMWASRSLLRSADLAVDISFSWNSDLHQSAFLTSTACCSFSIATMSSIAFLTLVKASSSTLVARIDNVGLWVFRAASRKISAACSRSFDTCLVPPTCMKLLKVPDMASRASSPRRISMASATALISWSRAFFRSWKFLSASEHVSFNVFKKRWSSESTPFSRAMSSFASAKPFTAFASWSSFVSAIFSPFSISAVFAARSSANVAARSCSSFWESDKFASISSLSCCSTPRISPLCALYAGM
mmetsp:Transcript_113970/g.327481  ORF Transcript_113970/g.327481 Transcript_113970/m.327481 type:complete len:295 (+) Transcript_113970:57-941(+)